MHIIVISIILLIFIAGDEASSNETYCDFPSQKRIIQECLVPFQDKLDFGQFFFARQFSGASPLLCKFYDEHQNCTNKFKEDCRTLNTQVEIMFDEICSDSFKKQLNTHRLCFDRYEHQFAYSSECFNKSELLSDEGSNLLGSGYVNIENGNKRCDYVRSYLDCSLNDIYSKACPVATKMIQTFYELFLNANQSGCDIRKSMSFPMMETNFTDFDYNITETHGNITENDLLQLESSRNIDECDLASEQYTMKMAAYVRRQGKIEYNPFEEFIHRRGCQAYKKYQKSILHISAKCRKMNANQERINDFYCSDEFTDLFSNQQNCVEQLKELYNESSCSNMSNFQDEFSRKENQNLPHQQCEFIERYIGCVITESFRKNCPQITEAVQNYFELLTNVNRSECNLWQSTINHNDNLAANDDDSVNCQIFNNCTTTSCPNGFYNDEQSGKCIDINECASNEHFCSQKCINKPGGYECQCASQLYKLSQNGHRCFRTDDEPVVFFLAHSHNIWNVTHDRRKAILKLLPNNGAERVAMFDYDYKERKLYYVDVIRSSIQFVSLENKNQVNVIYNHDVEGTEGIAVDWIHRNLYTVRQQQLHVQRLDGRFRTSLYKGLFRLPRALVAYPQKRLLFASDWSIEAFIVRLAMDGSQATKIVTKQLVWPNALAIDYFAERLYWADAFRDVIEMANLDGTGRRAIITTSEQVPHVFGLSVFDDTIFWSDWTNQGVLLANKLTGKNLTILVGTAMPPYSVKAYHSAMQMPAPNICEGTNCEHICVPKLDGSGKKCLCADDFIMKKDGTCTPNCEPHQFLCSPLDHKCLDLMYRCDGFHNCASGEDELGCPLPICMLNGQMFSCHDNRKCILRSQRCDGFVDCYDGSDELYCADLAMNWS